jgi:AcrR family transcriptional regulator
MDSKLGSSILKHQTMAKAPNKTRRKPGRPANSSNSVHGSERLLGVATALFARKGYDAVSIRDIASEADVTLSSLYHHFGDKRQLYIAVHMREFARSSARLEAAAQRGGSAAERIKAFTTELCGVLSEPQLFNLVARHWIDGDPDVVRSLAQATVPEQFKRVRAAMRQIAPDRNASALTLSLYAFVHGLLNQRAFAESLNLANTVPREPAAMAQFVLKQLLPDVDWRRVRHVQRSVVHRVSRP